MHTLRFSRLVSLGLLSGALAIFGGSCNSDYALFKIHPKFKLSEKASDRQNIEMCRLTITDEKGGKVLEYTIDHRTKINETDYAGCGDAQTPQDVGILSYSSSITSGKLNFQFDGLDNNRKARHCGSLNGVAAKAYHSANDEIGVDIQIDICSGDECSSPCPQ